MAHGILWVSVLFSLAGVYCKNGDDMMDFIKSAEPLPLKKKMVDVNADDLKRNVGYLPSLPDNDWEGIMEAKPIRFDDNQRVEDAAGTFFRSQGMESRGSTQPDQLGVKSLPHKPNPEDPEGCGNPICVVLDTKPRRFKSLCKLKAYLRENNRRDQINFVQKGDCYDIIDGDAKDKPWTNAAPKDCKACAANEDCKGPVVFIVDIGSMLLGTSTAPGGGDFSETQKSGQKLGGFPLEFPTICDAMKVFEGNDNLNKMTQVVGFIADKHSNDLFSTKSGDECLWTEWFDHDTPCNSENDLELYSDHYYFLQSSYTGPYRICLSGAITQTQHEGGSEITQVDGKDAMDGNAKGFDGQPFKQVITATKSRLECVNSQQTITELPAPFVFGDDKNNTCLDYKARYCCKVRDMWKPIAAGRFAARFPVTVPVGLAVTFVTLSTDPKMPFTEMGITVYPTLQVKESSKKIVIKCLGGDKVEATIKGGQEQPVTLEGTYTHIPKPDGSATFKFILRSNGVSVSTIEVKTSSNAGVTLAVSTKIKEERSSVSADSVVNVAETVKAYQKKKPAMSEGEVLVSAQKIPVHINTHMHDKDGGEKIIEATVQGGVLAVKKNEGALKCDVNGPNDIWEKTQQVLTTYGISTIVESPPTAILFHECEWRDWISLDHPGANEGVDGEYELRQNGYDVTEYTQHVCGNEPSQAHYIDAVSKEDQIPWYELTMHGKQTYETFKLTPYFGYACKDANGKADKTGKFCKDMKVRYCCEKKRRASWGDWEEWSTCSNTCDGGEQKRTRKCVQLSVGDEESSSYNKLCHGQEDWHSPAARQRFTTQTRTCNVENCPVDANMGAWTGWSVCTVTCGQGWKSRTRTCAPAQNGGVQCPPKTDVDKYVQTKACAAQDCERFKESTWSPWSRCSATCGKGVTTRKRDCVSMTTHQVVSAEYCAVGNGDDPLNQQSDCKLRECPVNGGWATWTPWSDCSQYCVSHPEHGKEVETKAYIARERYCASPMPRFNGKECPDKRSDKYTYKPETDSQEEKADCITENSKTKHKNAKITPWCPENCIYTQWGQWSPCSRTCVPIIFALENFNVDSKMTNVMYNEKAATGFPIRTRVRVLVKEARFNGECPEHKHNFDIPSSRNATVLQQKEECSLCKEHCTNPENPIENISDLRQLEPLTYPTDDPGCVGYCPEDCNVNPPVKVDDCVVAIDHYIKEDRAKFIKTHAENSKPVVQLNVLGHCLLSQGEFYAYKYKMNTAAKVIKSELKQIMESDKRPKRGIPAALEEALGELEDDDVDKYNEILDKYTDDVRTIGQIWFSQYRGSVKEPWVDGIAGGKHCTDPFKSKTISSWQEKLESDDEKYSAYPYFKQWVRDCELILCELVLESVATGHSSKCIYNRWSEWGQWASCTIKCGHEGVKKRTRVCQNTCTDEDLDDSQCTPYVEQDYVHNQNRTWTSSHEVPCDPCPTSVLGTWSTWSQWDYGGAPECIEGETKMIKQTRTRRCITSAAGGETCAESASGLTSGTETEEIPLEIPACTNV